MSATGTVASDRRASIGVWCSTLSAKPSLRKRSQQTPEVPNHDHRAHFMRRRPSTILQEEWYYLTSGGLIGVSGMLTAQSQRNLPARSRACFTGAPESAHTCGVETSSNSQRCLSIAASAANRPRANGLAVASRAIERSAIDSPVIRHAAPSDYDRSCADLFFSAPNASAKSSAKTGDS